ncbi:hypothetical protein VIGAN_05212000 [Vigna angularis var. angularis]|nr:hypothetical protein VIGAN_05212000 [Vigna angularis var. angularis]
MHIVSNVLHAFPVVPDISLNFEILEEISVVHCLEIPIDGYLDSKALFSDHLLEDMMMDSDRTAHVFMEAHAKLEFDDCAGGINEVADINSKEAVLDM